VDNSSVLQSVANDAGSAGTRQPLLYDVFCGDGGATKGYQRADFRVIGIDNNPKVQRHYCGDGFILMDALEFLDQYIAGEFERAEAFHASPPCKADNQAVICRPEPDARTKYQRLIAPTRDRLTEIGLPYVIENVPLARNQLINPLMLCGTMFGLKVRRHRYFETNFTIDTLLPSCGCKNKDGFTSSSSGIAHISSFENGAKLISVAGHNFKVKDAQVAMGIEWTGQAGLSQAIPPAYTEFIGKYLMIEVLRRRSE